MRFLLLLSFTPATFSTVSAAADVAGPARFPPRLIAFCAAKELQASNLANRLEIRISPQIWEYFKEAKQGNWLAISNAFENLKQRSSQYEGAWNDATVGTPVWQTLIEIQTAFDAFALGETQYALAFGDGIIQSVPPGSIYFGGTDAGRGLVTALCKSHERADPFYTITQNAFADDRYLTYLREMYGSRIYIPTTNDSQAAFTEYLKDSQRRLEHDRKSPNELPQIKPGEDVRLINGRVQVSGQVAVMAINALLAKIIFDRNTNCEFYVEESFPLDWMYPHLSPHGLIFKLDRSPLRRLTTGMMDRDRAFWTRQCKAMLGDWLKPDTSIKEVCEFVERIHVSKDLSQFTGDPKYVGNLPASRTFSKLRSSSGGLYQWWINAQPDSGDNVRLRAEADFAFRQAFALCPSSPEAIFRYVNLLLSQNRMDDAMLIARTGRKTEAQNEQLDDLILKLLDMRKSKDGLRPSQ